MMTHKVVVICINLGCRLLYNDTRLDKLMRVQVWDIRSKMLIQHYAANAGVVNSVAFHPSGNFLLSTCEDSTIRVIVFLSTF